MSPQDTDKTFASKVGLFFGSFNPVHIGHLIIANYFLEFTDLCEIWFVISPQNPLKEKKTLLNNYVRLYLVNLAIEDNPKFRACDIEFNLPQPSYTIHTLTYLKEKYPTKQFVLIIGLDNLVTFHKWKNYQLILERYELYIYPRYSSASQLPDVYKNHPKVKFFSAPVIEISSSFIRSAIKEGKDVRYFLPLKVYEYIKEMHFYKK